MLSSNRAIEPLPIIKAPSSHCVQHRLLLWQVGELASAEFGCVVVIWYLLPVSSTFHLHFLARHLGKHLGNDGKADTHVWTRLVAILTPSLCLTRMRKQQRQRRRQLADGTAHLQVALFCSAYALPQIVSKCKEMGRTTFVRFSAADNVVDLFVQNYMLRRLVHCDTLPTLYCFGNVTAARRHRHRRRFVPIAKNDTTHDTITS